MRNIAATAKMNDEIVARVENRKDAQFKAFGYILTQDPTTRFFVVKEVISMKKGSELVASFKFDPKGFVTDIWDIFNDNIAYDKVQTWADLLRANKSILGSAKKFSLLKDDSNVLDELKKLQTNIEVVQRGLGEVEGQLEGSSLDGNSVLTDIEADAEHINGLIEKLQLKVFRLGPSDQFDQCSLLTSSQSNELRKLYPGTWRILYQYSVDIKSAQAFHVACDNKGQTLTLIKSANNYLFGGFTATPWASTDLYALDDHASIFTLTNPAGTPPTKYNVVQANAHAIYRHSTYGPTFGGGHDICITFNGSNYTNFPFSYLDSTGRGNSTFTGARDYSYSDFVVFSKAD
jgi:hypothetical protein